MDEGWQLRVGLPADCILVTLRKNGTPTLTDSTWWMAVVQINNLYYTCSMGTTVQVRLDKESQTALEQLVEMNGWTASQAVRESLRNTAAQQKPRVRPRLIGIGSFDSGVSDLATNKKYMEGFGMTGPQKRTLRAKQLKAGKLGKKN